MNKQQLFDRADGGCTKTSGTGNTVEALIRQGGMSEQMVYRRRICSSVKTYKEDDIKHMSLHRILIVGYGSIGQALTPLLFRHFQGLHPKQIQVITADNRGIDLACSYGIGFLVQPLVKENHAQILARFLPQGGMLINVSVDVSSYDLIQWCQRNGVLYLDTCVEPWAGGYVDTKLPLACTTNYWLREQVLSLRGRGKPTAVIAHGANPGLVTHFIKQGLLELADDYGINDAMSFAENAWRIGVRAIHIAERDTQDDGIALQAGEFANTWSVDGLLSEAYQQGELGWGTHEKAFPQNAYSHLYGCRSGICLAERSGTVKLKSWVPSAGEQQAYLITHHEALSIADFLTVRDEQGMPLYRPTVLYAYRPSEKTCQSMENWIESGFAIPKIKTLMRDSLKLGFDELGVLFVFDDHAYWYGSTLTHAEANMLAPHNNATTLQVVSAMIGALQWAALNPNEGVVEAEDIPHTGILANAMPYLGSVRGVKSTWRPAKEGLVQFTDFLE